MALDKTRSRTKWWSISTCFVLACDTRLVAIDWALVLSHYKMGGWSKTISSSVKNDWIHNSSFAKCAKAQHLTSTVEWATIDCFLELQEMQQPLR